MAHSKVVGGSTAKRVIACPGSVALCAKMPPKPSSKYADEGTLCHAVIERVMDGAGFADVIGMKYEDAVMTEELYEEKIAPALEAMNAIDPEGIMEFDLEARVDFGDLIPDAFGTADVIGRIHNRVILLDWKFGDGVIVEAEENAQLMYYVAAAMRTPDLRWVFARAEDVELIIVQPPQVRRWVTTFERIKQFEQELVTAVKIAQSPDAPLKHGGHCRWCAAKPTCPVMTGAVDRALKTAIDGLDKKQINAYLANADLLEEWIKDLRALGHQMLEQGVELPDWKLVNKRATRKWIDESKAKAALVGLGLKESEVTETTLLSPAQAEKLLKKQKLHLPEDQVVSVSSGTTMAPASDPRPAVVQLGNVLTNALSKLV